DLINKTQEVKLQNPAGAHDMQISFRYYDAGNDWWWALDNVKVVGTSGTGGTFSCGDMDKDHDVDSEDLFAFIDNWTGEGGAGRNFDTGDCNGDNDVDADDLLAFLGNWTGASGAGRGALSGAGLLVGPVQTLSASGVLAVPEPTGFVLMAL